jgi:hypothetical protein
MSIKINPMGLFHTPSSPEEIEAYIQQFPRADRAALYVIYGITWNYLANTVNEHLSMTETPEEITNNEHE